MTRTVKGVTPKHRVKRVLSALRHLRGFDRAAHFSVGGTPADWRGKSDIRPDKRAGRSRLACRGPVRDD